MTASRRVDLQRQLGVRMDVLFKGEMEPSDRDLIAHIERGIIERMQRSGGQAPRFALVVGAEAPPGDVRTALEALA